jgi:2,4-diaminopentanoate dehydrogenase
MTRLRVVQWTTGKVAAEAVRATVAHPDLELVGAYAYSPEKVGRDVGELCGLDPIGVNATDDVSTLFALEPDCVVYNPLYPDVDELVGILERGINVVTTSVFLNGRSLGAPARDAIEAAAQRGNASIFGSGMNPGFADLLAAVVAGVCTRVHHVKIVESVDVTMFAADGNMDELGWGRPAGDPGHAEDLAAATAVFADALDVLADLFDVTLDERRCVVEFAHATKDLDLPGRPIPAGHVAGLDVRWLGVVDGRIVFELVQVWVMGSNTDPVWPVEHGYVIEVDGEPKVRTKLEIWPHQDDLASLTPDDLHGLGMIITALPAVNAIAPVCAAGPGIRTYADLPLISPRGRLQPKA